MCNKVVPKEDIESGDVVAIDNGMKNSTSNAKEDEEQIEKKKWYLKTKSRNGKLCYYFSHSYQIVNAGILILPYAFAQLGGLLGLITLGFLWIITVGILGLLYRPDDMEWWRTEYREFGKNTSDPNWVVMPQQLLIQMGYNIVYLVIGAKSLKKFIEVVLPFTDHVNLTFYIIIFLTFHLVLFRFPNFTFSETTKICVAVTTIGYALTLKGITQYERVMGRSYDDNGSQPLSLSKILDMFNGIGIIAFVWGGHNFTLATKAFTPSLQDETSEELRASEHCNRCVMHIYAIFLYVSEALYGLSAFGNQVEDDIMISFQNMRWFVAVINFMIIIHVIQGYQEYAKPAIDMIQTYLIDSKKFKDGRIFGLVTPSLYIVLTGFIAVCIPFLGGLAGCFGALILGSILYFVLVDQPISCRVCVIPISLMAILVLIGGLRQVILAAKTYNMFS